MGNFKDENIKIQILHKELDLIQDCIKRMASNSFLLKGWTVSLFAILLGLSKDSSLLVSTLLVVVVCVFWYLDAFFLYTERCYRRLYEARLITRNANLDTFLYDLNPHYYRSCGETIFKIMLTKTLRWFYGSLLFVLLIYILYIKKEWIISIVSNLL